MLNINLFKQFNSPLILYAYCIHFFIVPVFGQIGPVDWHLPGDYIPAIPSNARIDWYKAGLLSSAPRQATRIIDVTKNGISTSNSGSANFQAINTIIINLQNSSTLTVIYFPAGEYNISGSIALNSSNSNLVFQGDGINTVLKFTVGRAGTCFSLSGSKVGDKNQLTSGLSKGDGYLHVTDGSNYPVGQWVHYFEWKFPIENLDTKPDAVGQVTRIESKSGNTLTMRESASKSYSTSYGPYVQRFTPIHNVGIENLKILRVDSGMKPNSDPCCWENGSNISINYAVDCWIKGVFLKWTLRHHISVSRSAHLEISGCRIDETRYRGDGGYGYGVMLQSSTNFCLIENNIFNHLRHSMVLQGGANSNVFTYNYSEDPYGYWEPWIGTYTMSPPDLLLHGTYAFANLFEHNYVSQITADDAHVNEGSGINNGPYNAFVRNYMSSDKAIVIVGAQNTSVVGCQSRSGLSSGDGTSFSVDLYGKWTKAGYDRYDDYPSITHNDYRANQNFFSYYTILKDKSYYYSDAPYFLPANHDYPSIGPKYVSLSQSIPAKTRSGTFNTTKTTWPLTVTISGPTSLGYNIAGTFTANPSGGSGTYTNYRWWWRNDAGGGVGPESVGSDNGIDYVPLGDYWYELTAYEGQQTITTGKPDDFSLKCEVTDSDNNTATDIHSIMVGGGFAKAQGANTDEISIVAVPEHIELVGNYPNPFNPSTTIRFGLPEDGNVNLTIYSINGQKVVTLANGTYSKGYHEIKWNGKNATGNSVSNGIYIYELKASNQLLIKKMVFAK